MMVSLLHFSATIPFILFFPQFVSSATSVTYVLHFCDYQFNYTNNSSVFQNNLYHLLTNLSSQTPLTNFYNSTFGRDENTVYALSFCPAYIAAQNCQACVQDASHSITQHCPNQKKAIIYYVECVVRYANYSFFSKEEYAPSLYWNSSISFYNPDRLDQVLANTMDGLITKAAFGSSTTKTKFATGEAKITGSQQLYCFMQCTPDITENACRDCLVYALDRLQYYTHGKEWGLNYWPNCQARYQLVAFYEVVPPPSLPPSASTENTTFNTTGPPAPLQPSSGKKRKTSVTFITTITFAAILVILLIFMGNYLITRKVKSSGEATEMYTSSQDDNSMPYVESLQFDFRTIRDATDNFSHANKLGEGGFGPVYKGVLLNGQEIAVKKLSGNSRQGQEEFKNEVLLLTKLCHKNLVSLLGFCLEEKELLLIYEFMPNKSLDHFIFDHVKRAHLDWKKRFNIIQGFARGLLYLHEDSQHRIIHRDLKASNILLDVEMNPKISDFGTGRLIAFDQSHYTTSRIMGTIFGVILLEILSGQKIFCFRDMENGEDLLSYAWKCWRRNTILDIVDSTLMTGPKSEIMRCIHIGLLCVHENATDRPTMAIVVSMLISTSFSLSLPSHPAFFLPERQGQGNLLHEFNSMIESDQSETKSTQVSTNDATITELVA
ncbi:unnamed protein product [Camellia sinensis]